MTFRATPNFTGSSINALPVPYERITAAGAISVPSGVVGVNGTTLAVSLATPTLAQNGQEIIVYAENASAHVLTITGGTFNGGANNTGTYGGAIGDMVKLVAIEGEWFVTINTNVTLSDV